MVKTSLKGDFYANKLNSSMGLSIIIISMDLL